MIHDTWYIYILVFEFELIFFIALCDSRITLGLVLSGLAAQRKRKARGGRLASWRVSLLSRRNYVKCKMRSDDGIPEIGTVSCQSFSSTL